MERSTKEMRALRSALDSGDSEEVDRLLSDHFFRLAFLAPELVGEAYAMASEQWFTDRPRHALQRSALEQTWGPRRLTDASVYSAIEPWLAAQESPDEGDMLLVLCSHLRDANARGWLKMGSRLTGELAARIRSGSERTTRLQDIVPVVLFVCGHVEFLAGNRRSALSLFDESLVWSGVRDPHPVADLVRAHTALAYACEQRYAEAREVLARVAPFAKDADSSSWLDTAAILSRSLIAVGGLDIAGAERELSRIGDELLQHDLGWAVLAVRAVMASFQGESSQLTQIIVGELDSHPQRLSPESTGGAYLRVGLAMLHQRSGRLHAAQAVLETPGLSSFDNSVPIVAARQALLRGQPERALAIFERSDMVCGGIIGPGQTPTGSVLFAEAQLLATGEVSDAAVNSVVAAITHNDAPLALVLAGPELRRILVPLVKWDIDALGPPAEYRPRVKLTRREQEVLSALAAHDTLGEVAAALHISRNTAKSHLAALYRKLGVHSREHALGYALEGRV